MWFCTNANSSWEVVQKHNYTATNTDVLIIFSQLYDTGEKDHLMSEIIRAGITVTVVMPK